VSCPVVHRWLFPQLDGDVADTPQVGRSRPSSTAPPSPTAAFPDRFDDIEAARAFRKEFFDYYSHYHYHSGLGLHTPASVHLGTAGKIRADRAEVLAAAYARMAGHGRTWDGRRMWNS
jgi:hypothetical protein